MRPDRDNIAAPVFPGRIEWLGTDEPPSMAALSAGGPVLVYFFDFAALNSVRALPYVREWDSRYGPMGLRVLGIHSPRFGFTGDSGFVEESCGRFEVGFPVAVDADYSIWHDYDPGGWPSLFLWGRGGALKWAHFGEGEYRATEEAIQEELRAEDLTVELPEPMRPLRATDEPGALLPVPTAELFPGGSAAQPWEPAPGNDTLEVAYGAGGAWLVSDGTGLAEVAIDGGRAQTLASLSPGLTPLAEHGRHESHSLVLRAGSGLRVWAISFEPAVR